MRLKTIQIIAALAAAIAFVFAFIAAGIAIVSALFMAMGLAAVAWLLAAPVAGASTVQTAADSLRVVQSVPETLPALVALTPAQEARARAIEGQLRCPVCRSQ